MIKTRQLVTVLILVLSISATNASNYLKTALNINKLNTLIIIPDCTQLSNPVDGTTNVALTANLIWTAVDNAEGYRISIGTASGGTDIENNLDLSNITEYTPVPNWLEGTTYYVTVIAYDNDDGDATNCMETSFTTEEGSVTIPNCTQLSSPVDGETNVSLEANLIWLTIVNATGYKISIGFSPGESGIENNTDLGNVTSYSSVSNWFVNTIYYVTVTAYNDVGDAVGCVETTFTTGMGTASSMDDFVTTWQTDITGTGTSNDTSITIPTTGSGYDYDVDWNNDGVFDEFGITGNSAHDYEIIGVYTIRIRGNFPRIYFNNELDKDKILAIDQWGNQQWTSMENAFTGCSNLAGQTSDVPNLSNVTNMQSMFESAISFNQDIGSWNTSNVTSMIVMFAGAISFDQNLGDWSIQNLVEAGNMFEGVTLSTTNYDALLIGWEAQVHNNNIPFSGGNSQYCFGEEARTNLISNGWTITDGGIDTSFDCDALSVEDQVLNTINIFPNPSKDGIFSITWNNNSTMTFKVVATTGKIVVPNTKINSINNYSLDLSSLASGVYFIEFALNNKKEIKKLLLR